VVAPVATARHSDNLGKQHAEGSIDLTELNHRAAEAGAAATTAQGEAKRGDKLADAKPARD
jgi:hypothetical protein